MFAELFPQISYVDEALLQSDCVHAQADLFLFIYRCSNCHFRLVWSFLQVMFLIYAFKP